YATRLWLRVFFGAAVGTGHDPPPLMAWPLIVLAVPSALLGLVVQVFGSGFLPWLAPAGTPPGELGAFDWVSLAALLLAAAVGAVFRNRAVASGAAAVAFLLSIALAVGRSDGGLTGPVRPWHQLDVSWVPGLDLRFHLGVDGISYPLVVLTTLLTLLCCVYL